MMSVCVCFKRPKGTYSLLALTPDQYLFAVPTCILTFPYGIDTQAVVCRLGKGAPVTCRVALPFILDDNSKRHDTREVKVGSS